MSIETTPVHHITPIPADFKSTVASVAAQWPAIAAHVEDLMTARTIRNVYLVGSGASYFATWPARYLLDARGGGLAAWHLTSGEFVAHPPSRIGQDTLVIAASHTGHTAETLRAAHHAADAGAAVAAITRDQDSPLAEVADAAFCYATNSAIVESRMVLFQHFAHALTRTGPDDWATDSATLPDALHASKTEIARTATDLAERLTKEELVYVVGAGASFGVANALACCYLQEMQWMHAAALPGADFFHGPFEAVTGTTPVVVLLAEDNSRSISQRALRFLQRHSDNVLTLDSADLTLPGVPLRARAELSTFALASAARRVVDHVAAVRGHALNTRRYMHRVDY